MGRSTSTGSIGSLFRFSPHSDIGELASIQKRRYNARTMTLEQLRHQRIGLLGLGVNNRSLAEWLVRHGARQVTVLDEDPAVDRRGLTGVHWVTGPTAFASLTDFDILFRNPWIGLDRPELRFARTAGVEISSQTALFFARSPARIIGVTGTKGKGTTSSLIFEMIDEEGKRQKAKGKRIGRAYLAGNIGKDPFEFIDQLTPEDWVVLELSSFQLEDLTVSPHIAVVLAVSSEHLDRHGSVDAYQAAKLNLVAHQRSGDHVVLHCADPVSTRFQAATPAQPHWFSSTDVVSDGAAIVDGWLTLVHDGTATRVMRTSEFTLRGGHNLENLAAAAAAAQLAGAAAGAIAQAARTFRGLPHRLELINTVNGVSFYNDSYATSPLPSVAALRSFHEPIVLIVGGRGKGLSYDELYRAIDASSVKTIVCYGEEGKRFQAELSARRHGQQIVYERSFTDAVRRATNNAQPGDVVLLSPSATSYDQFRNYTERGDRFRQLVEEFAHGA